MFRPRTCAAAARCKRCCALPPIRPPLPGRAAPRAPALPGRTGPGSWSAARARRYCPMCTGAATARPGPGSRPAKCRMRAEVCACGEWTMQRACSAQCGWSSLASSTTMTGSAADLRIAMRSACPPEGGSSCRQPRRKAASHVTRKPTREPHRLHTVDASSRRCARTTDAACTSRQVQSRPSPITAGLSRCAAAASSGVSVRGSMTASIGRPLGRPPDTPGITNLLYQAGKGLAREEVRAQPVFANKEDCAAQQNQYTHTREGIAERKPRSARRSRSSRTRWP